MGMKFFSYCFENERRRVEDKLRIKIENNSPQPSLESKTA